MTTRNTHFIDSRPRPSRKRFVLVALGTVAAASTGGALEGTAGLVLLLVSVLGVALLVWRFVRELDFADRALDRCTDAVLRLRQATLDKAAIKAESDRLVRVVARLDEIRRQYRLGVPAASEAAALRSVFAALDGRELSVAERSTSRGGAECLASWRGAAEVLGRAASPGRNGP